MCITNEREVLGNMVHVLGGDGKYTVLLEKNFKEREQLEELDSDGNVPDTELKKREKSFDIIRKLGSSGS